MYWDLRGVFADVCPDARLATNIDNDLGLSWVSHEEHGVAMNKLLPVILAAFLAVSACAGEPKATALSPLKVNLDEIVARGVVHPVNGLTAAGQPDEASLKVFADSGYAAVIDLRTAGEERGLDEPAVVEELGMDYVSLPIGRDGISFENARSLDELIKSYEGPVLVHCGSSNRVGALLALRASLDGADDAAALDVGLEGGLTGLESKVREVLATD
jgi:uncharacterized protein (TIGR01244 family)